VILDADVIVERPGVNKPDSPSILQLELMHVRKVPARKRPVDRVRQRQKRMRWPDDHDPTRRGLQLAAQSTEEINPNPQPRPRHSRRRLPRSVLKRLLRLEAGFFCGLLTGQFQLGGRRHN
jgi:hypothetical protein